MLNSENWATIRSLYKEGYGIKTISRMLGISRNTVRQALISKNPPKIDQMGAKCTRWLLTAAPFPQQILAMTEGELAGGLR